MRLIRYVDIGAVGLEGPPTRAISVPAALPATSQPRRCGDRQVHGRFEVRLVEAGEDALGIVQKALGIQVRFPVFRVDEPVQALAAVGVAHSCPDYQFVLAGEPRQRQPIVPQRRQFEWPAVEPDLKKLDRLQLDECVRVRAGTRSCRSTRMSS